MRFAATNGKNNQNLIDTEAARQGKQTGRWSKKEHLRFVQAIKLYGTADYRKLQDHVGSRTGKQIRSHQQKYFMTLSSQLGQVPDVDQIAKLEGIEIPNKDIYVDP
jgi:SHAQKYF class myb-like DNA-binding protein